MSSDKAPIVVGIAESNNQELAVAWAVAEAARWKAPLRLVHAVVATGLFFDNPPPPSGLLDELMRAGETVLDDAHARITQLAPDLVVQRELRAAHPSSLLLTQDPTPRTVVLGAPHTHVMDRLFVGSTTTAVAAHAHCPVAVVRTAHPDQGLPTAGPVVLGLDFGTNSEMAIELAFQQAAQRGTELLVMHATTDSETQVRVIESFAVNWEPVLDVQRRQLDDRLARWRDKYPQVPTTVQLAHGRPRHELIEAGKRAQLLVVGSRGRSGFPGLLLGSTSHALLHHAPCPVIVARSTSAAS
ncbi:nucleotide-binding universal stress UspA family protein [Tamaricihabitans halophyticus]|uniref:Nucleotide-binding universal stress UspA family protein n=1 Tax=Tamaricihabitans halophyticus TaxID=1262583 RepID=A0A4R2QHQ5_9PSEU|nr:universal stress protein [Tamaricihabitans halophyticus]TCP47898.1 nucleotide-binding universal stress UspA family protein [Tamaricihabitans halophyticus]